MLDYSRWCCMQRKKTNKQKKTPSKPIHSRIKEECKAEDYIKQDIHRDTECNVQWKKKHRRTRKKIARHMNMSNST